MIFENIATASFAHVGIVVNDLDNSVESYKNALGMSLKRTLFSGGEGSNTEYFGEQTLAGAKLAFLEAGNVEIELIEPVDTPSTWQDFLELNGPGIHHLAFIVTNAEAVANSLLEIGVSIVQTCIFPGGKYIYLDGISQLGFLVELLEYDK